MRRTAILTVVSIFMSLGIAYSQENVLHRRDTVEMAVSDTVIRIAVDSLYSPVIDSTYRPGPSIRTNLFYLGSSTPNIGLEFPLGKHVTLGGNFGFKPWPRWSPWDNDKFIEKKWKHILAVPELRIWNKEVYTGPFIGLDGVYTHYNVGAVKFPFGMYKDVRDKRMQGDFIGLGLFTGRSWWLSDHWRLELEAGLAAGYNKADVYECAWCGDLIGEKKGPVIVPKLGLNLAWNLEPRRKEILELIDVICAPLDTLAPPAPVAVPVPFAPLLADVEEWKGVAGTLQKSHPVLRPSSEYKPYTPDRILRKEDGALYVFFELDKSRLLRSFSEGEYHRDNGPVLDEIIDITRQIMADTTSSVKKIQIVGLASIEGPVDRNQTLSDNRVKALQQYIQSRLRIPDSMFESVGGGEAWSEFRDQVNDLLLAGGGAGLTTAQLKWVLDVIDTEPNLQRREWMLRHAADDPALYRKLADHILHDQRNSGYLRIYYDYVPDESALEINKGIDLLRSGDYSAALKVLESKRDDDRSDNAYAIALWYSGREQEALSVLRKAAARGDEGCEANLHQLEGILTQRAQYEAYQKAVENYNAEMAKRK